MSRGERFLTRKPIILAVVISTVASIVLLNILPFAEKDSKATENNSVTKSSSADWDLGSNSGVTTTSDEVKLAQTSGWADSNYSYRKQLTVTAKASNTITKGHTLNLAGVGSASFDGGGDWFDLGNNFNNIALPVTIETWVKPLAADAAIFSTDDLNGGTYYGFWMVTGADNKVFLSYGDGTGNFSTDRRSKLSSTALTLNTWSHVTGVIRSATDMTIYINGVDAGGDYSGTGGNIAYSNSSDYPAKIGAKNAGGPHLKGNLDELRIWSKERSAADIQSDMYKEIAAQANLEGYYDFNQTTGTLLDNSGHNLSGTLVGNVSYSPYSNVWGGVNTKALIDAGKMRSDGNDLRLFYDSTEIERELIPATGKTLATSEATQVIFKAQAQVSGGASDNGYYLYYGDSDATDPIANVYEKKMRVKNAYIKPSDGATTSSLQYNADNFPTNGDGTFELWYKWSNPVSKAWAGPLFSGTDSNDKWMLFYDRSAYRLRVIAGGNQYNPTGSHNNTGDWNHIVVTWHNTDTNAQVRVYENNALTQSDDAAVKITSWPNYLKFTDPLAGYDGIELGHFGIYNSVKDSSWVSSQYSRTTAVPFASGRDAAATFIHNYDGSGLDATEANGGYASGTATATATNVAMSGDYRMGDTNDERANNSWVSGVYYWYDDFSGTGTKPTPWREIGKINTSSDAVVAGNDQHLLMNKNNIPTSIRVEAEAKGTGPKFTFNDTGAFNTAKCFDQGPAESYPGTDVWWQRETPVSNFISATNQSFVLQKRDYITNGNKMYIDIVTPGNYSGLTYQYWNGTAWTGFTPVDTTAGFSKSGYIDFSSIYSSLSGANPPTVGTCNFAGQTYNRFIKITAGGVTATATYNIIYNQSDFAENLFSNVANTLAGDLHSASGNTTIARDTSAYKKIAMSKTANTVASYFEGWQTFTSTASGGAWDNAMIGLSATTDATYDSFKAYKLLTNEPSSSMALEVAKYATGGYYSSPASTSNGSGIIDLGWIGGWGTPNGFSANVTIPTNTSIDFSVRSSAVGGLNDVDWTAWSSVGSATITGAFSVATASMPNITLGTNKYLQIKAVLNTTDGLFTPILSDFSVYYLADITAPTNPSLGSLTINGSAVTSSTWTSSTGNLIATFSGAADSGTESGLSGYYIYLGTSSLADPAVSGSYQAHSGAIGDNQTFNSSLSTSDNGKYYYLIFKTRDTAGNQSAAVTLSQFGIDVTAPNKPSFVASDPPGYTTTNSFAFTWPVATDPVGGSGQSGIKWYEYKRATDVSWSHTADSATRTATGVQAYQEGPNAFYVRSVDNAGNASADYQQVTYYWSGSAPDKPTNLEITPAISDTNSFSIHWHKPAVSEGNPPVVGYYYSVNAAPTVNNVTYVGSTDAEVTIGPDSFATIQGDNTFYVLTVNSVGGLSYEQAYVATATFNCQTAAPPAPTSVSLTDSSNREYSIWSLTLKWAAGPGQNAGNFGHYSIEKSTNGLDFSEIATSSSTAFIDASGLDNSTDYYYRVKSVDNAGKTSAASSVVHKVPTGNYLTPPTYLSQPVISEIKSSSVKISWTTDRSSSSIIRYGKTQSFGASSGQFDTVINHTVTLLGLSPLTNYYFQTQSLDEYRDYDPSAAYSTTYSFTTTAAPAVSGAKVENITLTTADISFETTTVSTSIISFGETNSYGSKIEDVSGANATRHNVKLSSLEPGTTYHFKVIGTDVDGNSLLSDDYQFDTLPLPKIDNFNLEPIADSPRPAFRALWNTNVPTSTILRYSAGEDNKEVVKAKLETSHSVEVTDLKDNSTYSIIVSGRDSLGNLTESSSKSFNTPLDSRPPKISDVVIESSFLSSDDGKSQISVGWKTDEPTSGKVDYGVNAEGPYSGSVPGSQNLTLEHSAVISGLDPSTIHHLKIIATDNGGNKTESENQVFVTNEGSRGVWDMIVKTLQNIFGFVNID